MGYVVQFVDSIAASPGVRLDLGGPGYTVREGTAFPPPELKYAKVGSLLSDGAQYPAAAYDSRVLKLVLRVDGASDDAIAAALQPVYRELNRPRGLLRYQPDTSAPVFFRTFRAGPDNVYWDKTTKEMTATIPADPFAYGLRETIGVPLNADTSFESGTVGGWTGQNGTVAPSTAFARTGSWSLRLTPTGGVSPAAFRSELIPVTAGLPYQVTVPMYSPTGYAAGCSAAIDWRNSSGGLISTTAGAQAPLPVGGATWTLYQAQGIAPAGAVALQFRARLSGGTPASTDVTYLDDATVVQYLVVANDPAAAINGAFIDVTGIKGDVETPLNLILPTSGLMASAVQGRRMSAIAVRRRGTPSAAPLVLQAEAMTPAADTTVQANSAVMSGTGSNWTRTTFATNAAMTTRLSIEPWPAVGGRDVRGGYKAFMRYRQSVSGGSPMQAQLVWGRSGSGRVYSNDVVTLVQFDGGAGGPYMKYAYLGEVQFPAGYDPVTDGPTGVEIGAEGMYFAIQAARTSGTAALDIDCLVLLPADDKLLLAKWPASVVLPADLVLESDRGQVYPRSANAFTVPAPGAELDGGPPMVHPGSVTNRIYFLRDVGTDSSTTSFGTGDDITATTALAPFYHPRYLYVRPVGS